MNQMEEYVMVPTRKVHLAALKNVQVIFQINIPITDYKGSMFLSKRVKFCPMAQKLYPKSFEHLEMKAVAFFATFG